MKTTRILTILVLVLVLVGSASAELVAHYEFEGNANDSTGNGYDGTVYGDPQWGTGQSGGGLKLDGIDDYVELPIGSLISSLTDCTIATWVNWSGQGGDWQRIFDFGTGGTVNMFLTPNVGVTNQMRFAITIDGYGGESRLTAPDTLATGWHHVAVVIDGTSSNMELYLDGVVVDVAESGSTETLPSDLGETTQNWLGRSQYFVDPNFAGSLDDFRIYNQTLSAA